MAQIINVSTSFVESIKRDVIAQSGTFFIAKAFLHNSLVAPVTDLSTLTDKVQTNDVTCLVIDVNRISITTALSLNETITYNRVYLTDINDNILIVVDIESITAREISDTFIYNLAEQNSVVL